MPVFKKFIKKNIEQIYIIHVYYVVCIEIN